MILASVEKIKDYTEKGWWGQRKLTDFLLERLENDGEKEALVDPLNKQAICGIEQKRYTFSDVEKQSEQLADYLLESGIRKNDIIILQLPNISELIITFLAIAKIGAIASPFPVQYREYEVETLINKVGAKAIITTNVVSDRKYAEMYVNLLDKLPTVELVFTWDEAESEQVHSLKDVDKRIIQNEPLLNETKSSVTANDIFTICWTSGTTGTPKGVPRSHNEWIFSATGVIDGAGLTKEEQQLNTFPLINMAGIAGTLYPWMMLGMKVVLHQPFDPQVFFQQIAIEKITYTLAPPPLLNQLLKNKELLSKINLSTVRAIGSGSAPLSPWMVKGWKEEHNIDIINYFASNEGSSFISGPSVISDPEIRAKYFPRFGVKGFDWDVRIADKMESKLVDFETGELITEANHPGELWVRGAGVFAGYWGDHEDQLNVFDKEGFFRTGDLFEIAGEGDLSSYYRVVGRLKDIIIRGGSKVSPDELENILQAHPKIAEVAVIGYPCEIYGERACACIVPVANETISFEEVTAYLKNSNIASFKIPEKIITVEALPRNPVGKVLKYRLKEDVKLELV